MEALPSYTSGSNDHFASMSLLCMLAEVATEKLQTDPAVQMITSKGSEFVSEPVRSKWSENRNDENDGKSLTLLQVSRMSDSNLLKFFSLNQANELKKKFYYTCRMLPASCKFMTQSFGNEDKAQNHMKKHLRVHLRALLQLHNTLSSQETYVLRSVLKQKSHNLSHCDPSAKKKGFKSDSKTKDTSNEKENSGSSITRSSFTLKPGRSYGLVKDKVGKSTMKLFRPNASTNDNKQSNPDLLPQERLFRSDAEPLKPMDKIISSGSSASNDMNSNLIASVPTNCDIVIKHEISSQLPSTNGNQDLHQEAGVENIDTTEDTDQAMVHGSSLAAHLVDGILNVNSARDNNLPVQSSIDIPKLVVSRESSNACSVTVSSIENSLSNSKKQGCIGLYTRQKLRKSNISNEDINNIVNGIPNKSVTVIHDHGYIGEVKMTRNSSSNVSSDVHITVSTEPDCKPSPSKDCVSVRNEESLLSQHMAIELHGGMMAQDILNQATPLPVVGSEVEFKPEEKKIKLENEEGRPTEGPDIAASHTSVDGQKKSTKKLSKGKGKCIGQSKLEKEMALELISQIKSQAVMEAESLECSICSPPRIFTAPSTLISHYKSHAGIRPYVCSLCQAVFTRQHSLNYHMLIHSNQTRFTCEDCGRKFRHPSHFKEHRRRHTGESPYGCMDCFMRFKTRNTYKRHLRTRHGKVLTTQGMVQSVCPAQDVANSLWMENSLKKIKEEENSDDDSNESKIVVKLEKDNGDAHRMNQVYESFMPLSNDETDQSGLTFSIDISRAANGICYSNSEQPYSADMSILAVDESSSVAIDKSSVINSNSTVPLTGAAAKLYRGPVVVTSRVQKMLDVSSIIHNPRPTSYLHDTSYDISISPVTSSSNHQITVLEQSSQVEGQGGEFCMPYWTLSRRNAVDKHHTCNVESMNVVPCPYNSVGKDALLKKENCDTSTTQLSHNNETLVNTIESVVNMGLACAETPPQSYFAAQISNRTEPSTKQMVESSDNNTLSYVDKSVSQSSYESADRIVSDKWTNLVTEVLSLSSAVNRGRQESIHESDKNIISFHERVSQNHVSDLSDKQSVNLSGSDSVNSTIISNPQHPDHFIGHRKEETFRSFGENSSSIHCQDFQVPEVQNCDYLGTSLMGVSSIEIFPAKSKLEASRSSQAVKPVSTPTADHAGHLETGCINLSTSYDQPHKEKTESPENRQLCVESNNAGSATCDLNSTQVQSFPSHGLIAKSIDHLIQKKNDLVVPFSDAQSQVSNALIPVHLNTSIDGKKEVYVIRPIRKPEGQFARIFKASATMFNNDQPQTCITGADKLQISQQSVIVTHSKLLSTAGSVQTPKVELLQQKTSIPVISNSIRTVSNIGETVLIQPNQGLFLSANTSNNILTLKGPVASTGIPGQVTNTVTAAQKCGNAIKVPVLQSNGNNCSAFSEVDIHKGSSHTKCGPPNGILVNPTILSSNAKSTGASLILNTSVASELSAKALHKSDRLSSNGSTSAGLNTVTLYPANTVLINSNTARAASEALTLHFSRTESEQSNVLILNSGHSSSGNHQLCAEVVTSSDDKSLSPHSQFVLPNSSSHQQLATVHKNNFYACDSPSLPNRPRLECIAPCVSLSSSDSVQILKATANRLNGTDQTNHIALSSEHGTNASTNTLSAPKPTGILNHLLMSDKSITSGSFYYSNFSEKQVVKTEALARQINSDDFVILKNGTQ